MASILLFLIDHFPDLLDVNLTASIVILFVVCVRQFMKGAPKIFSYALWAIVLLRLLVPISIESPMSFVPERTEFSSMVDVNEVLPPMEWEDVSRNREIRENTPPGQPMVLTGKSVDPQVYLSFLWLAGMVFLLVRSLLAYLGLRKRVKVSIPFRKGIYIADDIDTPFVMGFLRPKIYLPGTLDPSERKYIIAHERHHIRRGDHIFKALGFLALTIHWFNPFVWAAFVLAGRDMEMSCDEAVIRKLGEDVRAEYSASLLNLSTGHRLFAGTPLAFGEGDPTGRVRNLAKWKKSALWVIIICIILCSVLAVCLLTNPESPVHDTMTLEYFNRTMAHIEFHYSDDSATYQISEEYSVEALKAGIWQEVTRLNDKPAANEIAIVTAEGADHDAWSILKWEDVYGPLTDGNYRIRKEITKAYDTGNSETTPVYIEFTIGGTAEEYITYSLKDITPTGANLYEHEKVDDSVALVYNQEGFWLETLQNGQWLYMEPTENVNSVLPQEKYYIHELHYPSSHIELDWSNLYGNLPEGTYRIAREITNTDPTVLRLCTVYGEFTIGETASEGSTASNDWGVSIKPDRVSRTGATALFAYSGSIPGEEGAELTYGDFLSLDRLVDGNWVPCDELAGYNYFVGDSSYPVVDGYGMVHEWPERFGELTDGHYRLGKLVTLERADGSGESRMVYGEFTLPDSVSVGPIPLEDLPEIYSAEQAMIDGCFVSEDGHARDNQEAFHSFAQNAANGIPGFIRLFNCHYGEDYQWNAMDLSYDGDQFILQGSDTYTFRYLKHFTGEKDRPDASYDSYEYYVLTNDDTVTWEDILNHRVDAEEHWTVYAEYTYRPKHPDLPDKPNYAILEFAGDGLMTITNPDRLEKLVYLFENAEFLGYEPKTHSIGVGLNLILTSGEEDFVIELDPDSDICRINGEYVFYGAPEEPDYIYKLWEYLGITQWPDIVYMVCENALRP